MTFDPIRALATLAARHEIPFDERLLPTSGRLTRDDGPALHFLRWGGTRGPLVVLLHGGALTAHSWDLVAMALSPDHRCVALDLRGHGETAWADSYRIEASVADLRALLAHLAEPHVHLVGMSLGGNIAGNAAFELGAQLASLTLVDIAPGNSRDGTVVMRRFLAEADAHPTVDALIAAAQALSTRSDPDVLRYRYHYMTRSTESGWTWRGDRRRPPDFAHLSEMLARLTTLGPVLSCPLLVAVGERSRVLSEEAARAFAALFTSGGGRVVTIAGAGHNVQEDNPRALADALRAHIAGC